MLAIKCSRCGKGSSCNSSTTCDRYDECLINDGWVHKFNWMKLRKEWLCDECSTPDRPFYVVSRKVLDYLEKHGEASVTVTFPNGRKKVFRMKEDERK